MPEGNEVHRWAERHTAAFGGRRLNVLPGPSLRFADAHRIDGKKLRTVHALGKHLGYEFGPDLLLHVHLGRFGDWAEGRGALPEPKGALRVTLQRAGGRARATEHEPDYLGFAGGAASGYGKDDGQGGFPPEQVEWAELRGPTDCSVWTRAQWDELLERIGPDPLGSDAGGHDKPATAVANLQARKGPIAELLMDQQLIAGVGNIYRAEVLFRHNVNPFTPGTEMDTKTLRAIWKDLVPLMRAGMVDRRIVCTRRADRPSKKEPAAKGEAHYVYRRHGKPCFVCGTKILHRDMAARTLYWCPQCQHTTAEQNRAALDSSVSLRKARAALKSRKAGMAT